MWEVTTSSFVMGVTGAPIPVMVLTHCCECCWFLGFFPCTFVICEFPEEKQSPWCSHAWFVHGGPKLLSEEGNERWREGERTGIHILERKQAESAHLEETPRGQRTSLGYLNQRRKFF